MNLNIQPIEPARKIILSEVLINSEKMLMITKDYLNIVGPDRDIEVVGHLLFSVVQVIKGMKK